MTGGRLSPLGLAVLLLAAQAACLAALPVRGLAARLPDLDVTDLWDYPRDLHSIAAQGTTLFFICDIDLKECREGAVFFESRARRIREAGIRPVMLLRGPAADVRSAALDMDLDLPVYIDPGGEVIAAVLGEGILPALLLVSPGGSVLATVYGGGESLAGNIEEAIRRAAPEAEAVPEREAEPVEKKSKTWKYLLGAAAVVLVGILILAD